MYRVCESFLSLQGEGASLGKPSFFVRFTGCNLRCSWCDSSFSWEKSASDKLFDTAGSLAFFIEKEALPLSHVVFTGGEPLLYPFHRIFSFLPFFSFEVETNGSFFPLKMYDDFSLELMKRCSWNISFKLSHANVKENEEVLNDWALFSRKHPYVFFKFVVKKDSCLEDLQKIEEYVLKYSLPRERIILMPEGVLIKEQIDLIWIWNLCVKHGFCLSPRLHVIAFGDKKGV